MAYPIEVTMTTPAAVQSAVRDLGGEIRDRVEEVEQTRRLPADLHARFREMGVYRLLLPRKYGGLQANSDEVFDVIEELAVIDGSVAWATTIGIQSPAVFAWLSKERFEELHSTNADVTIGGAFGPQGTAEIVDGGYRVTGRWGFASGCDNWDWLFANSIVTKDGQPLPGPVGPAVRAMVVPSSSAEIIDTWHTLGMRGTGSQDFSLTDVFVPADLTFDLAAATPCVEGITRYPLVEFGLELATIAIGVAQGALNDLADAAAGRTRVFARTSIAGDPVAQHRIGKVATALRGAKALVRRDAAALRLVDEDTDFMALMTTASATCAWAVDVAIDTIETTFRTYGARGIYDSSTLQRRLRDITTLSQHATLNDSAWTRQGAALFGQVDPPPMK